MPRAFLRETRMTDREQRLKRSLRFLNKRRKALLIVDRKLREHLPVEGHAGLFEAVDEFGIIHAVEFAGGGDSRDPQGTKIALLALAAHIGIGEGLHNGLVGSAEKPALAAPVTLCKL